MNTDHTSPNGNEVKSIYTSIHEVKSKEQAGRKSDEAQEVSAPFARKSEVWKLGLQARQIKPL
jgi:hypothetical protein